MKTLFLTTSQPVRLAGVRYSPGCFDVEDSQFEKIFVDPFGKLLLEKGVLSTGPATNDGIIQPTYEKAESATISKAKSEKAVKTTVNIRRDPQNG